MQQVVTKMRIRVFVAPDGTYEVLIGGDQIPDPSWKLIKDQDVVETKVVTDHAE